MNKLVLVLPVALLFGCADINKQQLGTTIGAATGGLLGNQVGHGTGRVVATAAGVLVGGYVGNRIGKNLDEQDRKKLSDATLKTAETGRTQVVSSSTGTTMRTEAVGAPVTRRPQAASQPAPTTRTVSATPAAAPGPVVAASDAAGGECKVVRQTVSLRSGDKQEEDVRLCKGPNGWEVADA